MCYMPVVCKNLQVFLMVLRELFSNCNTFNLKMPRKQMTKLRLQKLKIPFLFKLYYVYIT